MMNKILLIIIFNISFQLNAQNVYIENLNNSLNRPQLDVSEKMKIYHTLVEQYRIEMIYDKAVATNKKFLELAKKEKSQSEIAIAYVNEGLILINQGKFEKAQVYIDSLKNNTSKNSDEIAKAYTAYFTMYLSKSLGDYKKAMNYGQKALAFLEVSDGNALLDFKINYQHMGFIQNGMIWRILKNMSKKQ